MPTILCRSPFYLDATTLRIPNGPAIEIQPEQIVVWVSIAPTRQAESTGVNQRLPALLDLGFNGYFLLREDHLSNWLQTRLDEERFPFLGAMKISGEVVPTFEAEVWLHPNVPGFRDQITDAPPLRLETDAGIAVFPANMTRFHLPLIGLSALRKNALRLFLNGEKKYISLRTPLNRE